METHKEKFKIRLGLFVVGGLVLFVLTIFIIGKQNNLFNSVIKVNTTFYNVSGLQVGNNVRFSGINVGTVGHIHILNDTTVRVEMLIKTSVQQFIKTDSEVAIGSEGLIGDKLLSISHGSTHAKMVKDGHSLVSSEPVDTDAIIASLEVTAMNAEVISMELAEIMEGINRGEGTLGRLIKDTTIADNLSKTMQNLKSSTKGLDENMNAAKENFLLRGYFKRKKRDARKKEEAKQEAIEEQNSDKK